MELDAALRSRGRGDVADELLLAALYPDIVGMQLTGALDPTEMGGQFAISHPFAKGKVINLGVTPLGAGSNTSADLVTTGYQYLTLLARLGNATTPAGAAGDLTLNLAAYEDDGTTVFPGGLTGAAGITADQVIRAAALSGNFAQVGNRYILGGIDKVSVKLTNNNIGALQGATAVYFLQK